MKKLYILIATLLVVLLTSMMLVEKNNNQLANSISNDEGQPLFHKGMITIKVKEGFKGIPQQKGNVSFGISSLDSKSRKYEVDLLEERFKYNPKKMKKGMPDLSRIYRIEFPEDISVTKVAREFSKDLNIEYAEPIPMIYLMDAPNDPMYGQLWNLPKIQASEAWDIHKGENGTEEVVIAIIDSGVDWDHEDLVDNIWQNLGEDVDGDGQTLEFVAGAWIFDPDDENGVDDDGNGYIDDFIGWNFYNNCNDPNPIPGTYKPEHGTLCSGWANATTNNNIGVASIAWNLKTMPVQCGWDAYTFQCYNAVIYAGENGADIISCSWGHYGFNSIAYQEAIDYVNGLGSIIVAGASGVFFWEILYPAASPGVISVAALNSLDVKSSYCYHGPQITICAPGGDFDDLWILTTDLNNTYTGSGGTSCATPITAGLLGLVKSYHPEWTKDQVITQVLGTTDDIDSFNPGYENQLGSGRINAYRALTETSVTLEQEITIDFFGLTFQDSDNNNMLEAGDTANLNIKLRNYNYGVGAENATFMLTTDDPDITILNDTYTADIPADNYFTLEDAFEFVISEETTTHLVNFELVTSADKEIAWGDTIAIEVLIAPSGILVFQGEGTGNAYSGDFINENLIGQGFDVFYTSHFPSSLEGFDAVFVSYGNYGAAPLLEGTPITMEMTESMQEYLINGGKIYIDCGTFFGSQVFHHYPDIEELMSLFGVGETDHSSPYNLINMLSGLPGSICEDLVFSGSTQTPWHNIDKLTPNENGIAAFEEDDYGVVAVQGEGEYGQKTFCFSYALAHLEDGSQGTRDELMYSIVDFFDLYDPQADFMADTTFIEEGDTIHFTDLSGNDPTSWEWQFEGGTPTISTNQNPAVIYNTPGLYDVALIVTNEYGTDTLTIEDYITVDPETGIIAQNNNEVIVYPNPVNDLFIISSNHNINSLEILNYSGQVVKTMEYNVNQIVVNMVSLPDGIYFIRLKIEDEEITKKIVKMR
ncbi:MAG: S8 family serine peptidase [Bacteroidales bacterium]|nr:S8 family serine peptidase [Bacteroidales bacterium]